IITRSPPKWSVCRLMTTIELARRSPSSNAVRPDPKEPRTMTETRHLPAEYADLEPFVAEWCLTNERDRFFKLLATSIPELQRFFDAMSPRSEEIALRLNEKDPASLSNEEKNLFW